MRRSSFRSLLAGLAASAVLAASVPARAQTDAASADAGSRIYTAKCAACHQVGGSGMAGAFPPLAGHVPDLLKPADGRSFVEKVLLYGLEGEISVNGNSYAGAMPAWNALSDVDVAAVLNYVSNAWDNGKSLPSGFKPFTPDEIKALRSQPLTPSAVYALRSGAVGGPPASATAGGAGGTTPVSFTADQVARGSDIYAERCVQCHGDKLDNGEFGGAALNGSYFKKHWSGGRVAALTGYMKAKMPPDRPGSLTDQSYADLAAFLLDANDYPKGDKELPTDSNSQQTLTLKRN